MPPNDPRHRDATSSTLQTVAVATCVVVASMMVLSLAQFDARAVSSRSDPKIQASDAKVDVAAVEETPAAAEPGFNTELVRGRVVWLSEALQDGFGISTVPEAASSSLAMLTDDGELLPIVENLRGRAFRKDERLRNQDMELLVRRYKKQPLVQILRVYEIVDKQRYEVDYWCDVCAIVMFETGPCACCQDDNRLRKRPAPK